MGNILQDIKNSVKKDLLQMVSRDANYVEGFYFHIIASNPKYSFTISGLQHFLGTAFLAARLADFLGLGSENVCLSFLSGLLHDLNKWDLEEDLVLDMFKHTNVYVKLTDYFGKEGTEEIIQNALAVARTRERGGAPRQLQRISELVEAADNITGDIECRSIWNVMNYLRNYAKISEDKMYPVVVGRLRPIAVWASRIIREEMEKRGVVPLISTPEGMLLLTHDPSRISTNEIYERIAAEIMEANKRGYEGAEAEVRSRLDPFMNFLRETSGGGERGKGKKSGKRSSISRLTSYYKPLPTYRATDFERLYNECKANPEMLRVFTIFVLYIATRTAKEEEFNRVASELGFKISSRGKTDAVLELYELLSSINDMEKLDGIARKAKDLVISKRREISNVDHELLLMKLRLYVTAPSQLREGARAVMPVGKEGVATCKMCGEPIGQEKLLGDLLSSLGRYLGEINVSEMFVPGIPGNPTERGAIEEVKKLPICEVCYFEGESLFSSLGIIDGLWSSVLVYSPSMPIDLLDIIEGAIEELERRYYVIPDYLTSRMILGRRERAQGLDKDMLLDALKEWFVFGGNLIITRNPLTAIAWHNIPVQLDVRDSVVGEANAMYLKILEKSKERGGKFLTHIRHWLYKTLETYFQALEEKDWGEARGTDLVFRRATPLLTGFPSLDSFVALSKQLQKEVGSLSISKTKSGAQLPKTLYVTGPEYQVLQPAMEIARYIKGRIANGRDVSDHHISRFVPELEAFIAGRKFKAEALAEIIGVFSRHFGFETPEEKEKTNEAVANLLDRLEYMKSKNPVRAHELVKGIRTLVIVAVRGDLTLAIEPRKREEG